MSAKQFVRTLGHEKQKEWFFRASRLKTLGHAFAFTGPPNVGKTTFAVELAEILGADPILDVFLFNSIEGLSIGEARILQNNLSLTPVGSYKVAIVGNAENMTLPAANSLLKILEEPPAHSVVILVTANFYALLPTIMSRVQRLNFFQNSETEVRQSLQEFSLSASEISEITKLAVGRIGLARRLAEKPELLDFYRQAASYYQVLQKGNMLQRLLAASEVSRLNTNQISEFLQYAMSQWVAVVGEAKLADKLMIAFRELLQNLNQKLLLDNLFLP